MYSLGSSLTGATTIGALLALVLLSGIASNPDSMLSTLTQTVKVPYRIAAAGTSAISFVSRFRQGFRLLRTARAVRGIGRQWGFAAPIMHWLASLAPLVILAVQHAERVALSMDSRAFGAHETRTELRPTPWRLCDWIVVALGWTLGILLLLGS